MKASQFIMFLSVALTIYLGGNSYLFIRGMQALPDIRYAKGIYTGIFIFLAAAFVIGEILERNGIPGGGFFIITGSFWLSFLLYAVLCVFVIDLVRFANYFAGFLPEPFILRPFVPLKLMLLVILLSVTVTTCGAINALNPAVRMIDIRIDKKGGFEDSLNIVAVSDIHLGCIVGRGRIAHMVKTINSFDPDIVLFPGDFFDETPGDSLKDGAGDLIKTIRSRYGVYAVTGNHEYIAGVEPAVASLKRYGITVLQDELIVIQKSLVLAGRKDRSIKRFTGDRRRDLNEILAGRDTALPLILMDHQPSSIKESVNSGVDLHISGHTHNGQLWPVNYITDSLFDVSYGYKKIENTHVYVSNGYGTWGPPVRTTGRPEIVVFQIRFRRG